MPEHINHGVPLVTKQTRTESSNVETLLGRLRSKRLVIPDYQRDAEQWDRRKESLFIESLLNNLTIPAFFFAALPNKIIEVVDGQQRLNTILKYFNDEFEITNDPDIVYLSPQNTQYVGKKFSDLSQDLQFVFNDYPLTIIYLPDELDLSTKLEIFRRINEGGTPLTAQDIRLSYYSDSKSIYLIRLAGIYADSTSARRMIESAGKKGVNDPWKNYPKSSEVWQRWWEGKALAKGQTASEMFLWYLILIHRDKLNLILSNPELLKHLKLNFREKTEEALDIYCAHLQYIDSNLGTPKDFPTYENGMEEEFNHFAESIEFILNLGSSGISVDKYKQTAFIIGAAVELGISLKELSDDAWDAISVFLKSPRKTGDMWLKDLGGYPEQKGRWGGKKGQKAQCDMVVELLSRIIEKSGYK